MRNVHLTRELVAAVRDAADVVAIASEHTRLARRGHRYLGLCPLHKEKTPSFSVDAEQGLFYCFGCGAGGDAIKLHMLTSGDDFAAAIEALALRYGIPLPAAREGRGGARRERATEGALEAAAQFFRQALKRSLEARQYLERRRIPEALAEGYGLGYAPDAWRDLSDALAGKIPEADLEAAGLLARSEAGGRPYDRFRHRLVFPITSPSGRIVGFGGRTLGDDRAKYLNTSETEDFHKGRFLYGLNEAKRAIREGGRAVLVEGYFDVLGAVASGVDGAVASMGTALTADQAKLLARYAEEVVVGYDGDEAGENAFRRALPLLLGHGLGVRRARFGAGHDPDSLRLAVGPEAVKAAVEGAEDGVLAEIDRLLPAGLAGQPLLQARAAEQVAEFLRPIRDPLVRYQYGRRAAQRVGLPDRLVLERLDRLGKGAARAPAEAEPPAAPAAPSPVRSLEEQVLERLLAGGGEVPAPADLPDAEVFFDAACRNIFRVFRALYTGEGGGVPTAREVAASLEGDGAAVALVSRLANSAQDLLEKPVAPDAPFAPDARPVAVLLDILLRRREAQDLQRLTKEIEKAEREGDRERAGRLASEKLERSRRHHRSPERHPVEGKR